MERAQQMFMECAGIDDVSDVGHLFTDIEVDTGVAYSLFCGYLQHAEMDEKLLRSAFEDLLRRGKNRAAVEVRGLVGTDACCARLEMERRERLRASNAPSKRARVEPPPRLPQPAKARFGTSRICHSAKAGRPQVAEAASGEKWLRRLLRLMEESDAPSLDGINRGGKPLVALKLLAGGRRASTLRARVRAWERFAQWVVARWGTDQPRDGWDFIDYLSVLAQKPVGRSALKAAWSMYRFRESVSGLDQGHCFSELKMVRQMYEGVVRGIVSGKAAAERGKAPRVLVSMLRDAGRTVLDEHELPFNRIVAWYVLLSAWGVLRFSDHLGVEPGSLTE